MTRLRRLLVVTVGSVLGIPLTVVAVSPLVFKLLQPGPWPVSPEQLPERFPVLGVWEDSTGSHCRAFVHGEIERAKDQLPAVSLALSSDDQSNCAKSLEAYNATGKWPDSPSWSRAAPPPTRPARFEVSSLGDGAVEVHVGYDLDDDAPNDGWYEVRDGSRALHNPRYLSYFGPGFGIGLVAASVVLGVLVYALVATVWVLLGSRAAAVTDGSSSVRVV